MVGQQRLILFLWILYIYISDSYLRVGLKRLSGRFVLRKNPDNFRCRAKGGDVSLPADGFSTHRNELSFAPNISLKPELSAANVPLGKRTAALANSDRNTSLSSSIPPSTNFEDDDVECGTSKEPFGEFNEGDDDMKMVDRELSSIYDKSEDQGDEWAFIERKRSFDELTDDEYQRVMELAVDDDHKQTLGEKVAAVMEQEWDIQQGVTTSVKPQPLEANLNLATYHARQAMIKRGNFTEAAEIYQRCIDYNPVDGRAWLGLARIYQKRGFPLEAEKCFKDGLYYSPKNPYLLQSWAVMLEKQGKISQAMKLLRTSVMSNPKHSASWVALGQINLRKGKTDEARFCFRSAVDGDGKSYVALQAWGVLESKHGRLSEARSLFKRALQQSRNSVHTLQAWATLERNQGNFRAAEKLLRRALKEWPKSTRSRVGLAEIRELRGDIEEARKTFKLGQKIAARCGDAGFFQSWALLETRIARAQLKENKEEEMLQLNSRKGESVAINGDSPKSNSISEEPNARRNQEHRSMISEGKASQIRGLFRRAISVNKYHSASWIAWAKFEQHNGNPDVARRLLTEGINHFPHSKNIAWFHTALGNLAWHRGDVTTARACYSRALDTSPPQRSLSILLEYAKMEIRLGSRMGTEARELFERAVTLFPREERAWSAYIDFERSKERLPAMNAPAAMHGPTGSWPQEATPVAWGDGSSSRPHPDIERAQLYNPGGAVNRLIMRRKEANSLASKPKLVVDTDWEENLEFGGI